MKNALIVLFCLVVGCKSVKNDSSIFNSNEIDCPLERFNWMIVEENFREINSKKSIRKESSRKSEISQETYEFILRKRLAICAIYNAIEDGIIYTEEGNKEAIGLMEEILLELINLKNKKINNEKN